MDEFLSTRQVIDILKVDRITIYRMQQDGRLKGIKIGQQWRFSRGEVERLLGAEPAPQKPPQPDPRASFPTHCVQTIQDLYSEISQMSALMVDRDGNPVTQITHPCRFCQLILQSPEGRKACQASWTSFAQGSHPGSRQHTCHAGLEYVSTPVVAGAEPVGAFLTGQHLRNPLGPGEADDGLRQMSAKFDIPFEDLQQASRQIPVLDPDQKTQLQYLVRGGRPVGSKHPLRADWLFSAIAANREPVSNFLRSTDK